MPKHCRPKLPQLPETFIGKFMKEAFFLLEFRLVRLTDIHLHSSVSNELEVNGNYRNVVSLGIIACLVLLIAFINYINLATSRSIERAHEVGVRKISGALQKDLIFQFLTESAYIEPGRIDNKSFRCPSVTSFFQTGYAKSTPDRLPNCYSALSVFCWYQVLCSPDCCLQYIFHDLLPVLF